MAASVCSSGPLGPPSDLPNRNYQFFSWSWLFQPLGGGSKSMDRMPSSSSSTSSSSAECRSSVEAYSRSSSGNSTGPGVEKYYIPLKAEMKKVFDKFDENRDGKICGKDLHRFMGRLGMDMSLEEAKSMLQSVDHNSDGCVDFEEFYSLYLSLSGDDAAPDEIEDEPKEEDEDDTLLQVFKVFDRDGDGVITPQELQEVLIQLGIPEGRNISDCKQMIERVDSNGDEKIDITEFKSMMWSSCFQK